MSVDPAPVMLTPALLDRFHESLRRAGFPDEGLLYPGLSDAQMDEITAPLGLTLPTEARVWWARQNGGRKGAVFGSDQAFASLEEMVAVAVQLRALHHQLHEEDGVVLWDDRLLPLVHAERVYGCDCSVAPGDPSPISIWIPKDAEDLSGPVLPSFGALVDIWATAIDEGLYEYLPDEGFAVNHLDQLEPGRWPHGLP